MTKDKEIRMINEKLDFYVMEASDEEALKDFWDYCEETSTLTAWPVPRLKASAPVCSMA